MNALHLLFGRVVGPIWLYLGRWLDGKGMASLAESCFRSAGASSGKFSSEAGFRLSQLLLASNRNDDAIEVCERALEVDPRHAKLWCALGAAKRRLARMEEAREAYEKAIALAPSYAQAWTNLGEWLLVKGEFEAALEKFEQALKIEPRLLQALNNRVAALYELGRFRDAEAMSRKAIEIYPSEAALHVNLGNVLLYTGKARQAAKSFQKALDCDPSSPEAQIGLATLLGESHRLAETLAYRESEIAVKGENAQRLAALAFAQQSAGNRTAAEATCEKLLAIQPNNISALIILAGCLAAKGNHRDAIEYNERALVENPDMPSIYSVIAFDSTYLADATPEEVFAFHRGWANRFEKGAAKQAYSFDASNVAGRPLRIGYVSGDFGVHPVGFLLRDVAQNHDHGQFTVHCYSMMRQRDEITDEIRASSDYWIDALFMSDDELADKIHEDRIDILVDLSGHTAYNRLPVFVRKPAPVQATWIGYFHSTGLESIDYYITDPYTTPANSGQLFSEIPVCLPHSRFCFSAPDYAPAVAPVPISAKGYITFGCFNRVEKLVEPVIETWVKILSRVPESRLLLKAGGLSDTAVRDSVRAKFASYGLATERLELQASSPHQEMLDLYGNVDIALDPFPFNGGMTTLEALWMGVPVVALEGESVVARQSTSVLANVGLNELIFRDLDAYVEGAVALSKDIARLERIRRELRDRMANSPICQAKQFTLDLEALYRRMWRAWCNGGKLPSAIEKKQLPH